MYIPSPAHQTNVFLLCIGFGFLLGIFYHIVRFLRKSFLNFKKAVLIQDIFFCIISTLLMFCFLLCCNDGEVRFFLLVGFFLGFLVYYSTFGVFVAKNLDKISSSINRISALFRQLLTKIFDNMKNKAVKNKKTFKKITK